MQSLDRSFGGATDQLTPTGFEAETLLGLPRRMSLGLAVAYNRAISEDFPNAPNAETMQSDKDLGGEQLYNAPVWVARASLGQALPLEARSEPVVQALGDLTQVLGGRLDRIPAARASVEAAIARVRQDVEDRP